ncbi:MAG: hypothetical protein UHW86_09035 [Spirochaetota bacterium]|nr:hypothetical protein [Spirochaetota bacterium]
MKNNFFAILLSLIISVGCTQETVINANIDEKLNNSGPTLKVQIKTENSRTIRPEVTKWKIKLFESNEQLTTRVLHGKDNTVTTFTNVTTTEYKIEVFGYTVEGDKDCKILFGEEVVKITANETKMCVVTVNDNFETQSSENPNGTLSVNISGLTALGLDELVKENSNFTLKMSGLTNLNNPQTVTLSYKDGVLSGVGDNILSGSYKIESISFADAEALPTGEVGDSAAIDVLPINLIQDPIVNIYPGTTTYINWTWNYSKEEITQNNMLKNTLVPVWNKPVDNRRAESSVPAKNGSLSANALFAEPTWDEKSYDFTVQASTGGEPYSANIPASKLEFINCTYDESDDLWVLSGTSDTNVFFDDNNFAQDQEYYCYVLKNVSASETKKYQFTCSSRLSQDFAVATVGEQNEQNKQKYLFYITESDGYNIKRFKIENKDKLNLDDGIPYYYDGNACITAIYAKGNNLYMAITENGNCTTANIYTGIIINESGDFARYGEDNQPDPILSLGISDFTNETIQNSDFYNPAFAISDMYINEDKTKLYVTASCVNYNGNSWNNNQYYGFYHSFGGLFVYDITGEAPILSGKYGIDCVIPENATNEIIDGYISLNAFLKKEITNDVVSLKDNIMQAETEDSQYFAGPRYIIPAGEGLLIVDSGFYGVYKDPNTPLTDCEKRNRIFTYNITENELSFNSITKVDDSISFDYDYLVNSGGVE